MSVYLEVSQLSVPPWGALPSLLDNGDGAVSWMWSPLYSCFSLFSLCLTHIHTQAATHRWQSHSFACHRVDNMNKCNKRLKQSLLCNITVNLDSETFVFQRGKSKHQGFNWLYQELTPNLFELIMLSWAAGCVNEPYGSNSLTHTNFQQEFDLLWLVWSWNY